MRVNSGLLFAAVLLAGCGEGKAREGQGESAAMAIATPTEPTSRMALPPAGRPAESVLAADTWLGRWVGVEGLVLEVARGDMPATYRLHVVLLDGASDYIGQAHEDTIRFERNGKMETIRATDGEGTGLKWLAGKKDCLVIQPGEGFCRD